MMRLKKKLPDLLTRESAEEQMQRFAEAAIRQKKLEAELELSLTQVRARYQSSLEQVKADQQEAHALLERYAQQNHERLFAKGRSCKLQHGTIGFRQGTPQVVKRRGATWTQLIEILRARQLPYVRSRHSLDKQSIISQREDKNAMQQLSEIGLSVVQTETFFCETRDEETD